MIHYDILHAGGPLPAAPPPAAAALPAAAWHCPPLGARCLLLPADSSHSMSSLMLSSLTGKKTRKQKKSSSLLSTNCRCRKTTTSLGRGLMRFRGGWLAVGFRLHSSLTSENVSYIGTPSPNRPIRLTHGRNRGHHRLRRDGISLQVGFWTSSSWSRWRMGHQRRPCQH